MWYSLITSILISLMDFERKTTTDGRKGGKCNIFLMNDNYCHDLGWRLSNVAEDTHPRRRHTSHIKD